MRIPYEALAQFANKRAKPESRRTEPINSSSVLDDDSQFNSKQWLAAEAHADPLHIAAPPPSTDLATPHNDHIFEEPFSFEDRRIAGERRQRNIPVLLDTRLSPSRRNNDKPNGVDLAV